MKERIELLIKFRNWYDESVFPRGFPVGLCYALREFLFMTNLGEVAQNNFKTFIEEKINEQIENSKTAWVSDISYFREVSVADFKEGNRLFAWQPMDKELRLEWLDKLIESETKKS